LLWELDFDDKGPVVLVDGSAGGAQRVGRNDLFIATAYPEILRQALTRALIVDRMPHDDPQHWISRWYDGYLRAKLRMKPPPANNDEACREWIDEAVRAFGRHYQVVRHWATDDP